VIAGRRRAEQSCCSPWQNDYRECVLTTGGEPAPTYVNVETTAGAVSIGNNWMDRSRTPKGYEPDKPQKPPAAELRGPVRKWQGLLRFIVDGRDHD